MLHIFDIDGVLADDRHRVGYALDRQWDDYFLPERVAKDGAWPEGMLRFFLSESAGARVAYLTGRRSDLRKTTEAWLAENGFPVAPLVMRPYADRTPLAALKVAYLTGEYPSALDLSEGFVLFDDDPVVVDAVREACGYDSAVHCAWHTKPTQIVSAATA